MVSKQTISAVIITLNEEADIRRCLESIRWADEIVVVDSGSTDKTPDICREYGCSVFSHNWEGYARQKDFAMSLAHCDWILSIDGDEEITPELADEIKAAIRSNGDATAYTMPRCNLFLGKWLRHGGWYPDRQIRVFRRGAGKQKPVPLHEHIILDDPSARIGSLTNRMMHYTYPSVADFIRRTDSYTTIEADSMLEQGRIPKRLALRLLTAFPLKFAETYICKSGWRDGIHGFIASMLTAARVFIRYAKVWERLRNGKRLPINHSF